MFVAHLKSRLCDKGALVPVSIDNGLRPSSQGPFLASSQPPHCTCPPGAKYEQQMLGVALSSHTPSVSLMISSSQAPVFILGSPRSGTTLLYHMLLSAGGFAVYRSETHVFDMIAPRFGDLSDPARRRALMDVWLQSSYFQRSGLDAEEIRHRVVADCRGPGDFLRITMGSIAENQQVDRWADCTPKHVLHLREIKREIPEALIVHIIRDGRDVALSLQQQGWIRTFPGDTTPNWLVAGYYWDWMMKTGTDFGARAGADYLEVRFEDLVQQPEAALKKVGNFIDHDLDYDRISSVAIGSVSKPNTSFAPSGAEAVFNPVGRWRDSVPIEEVALFEAALGNSLESLGYELTTPEILRRGRSAARARAARSLYQSFYTSKQWIKSRIPLSRFLVDTSRFYK